MTCDNILVIKHGALGDIVLATAAFAAIRRHHPQAHITLLTTQPYAQLLAQSPYFNEIWVDSKPEFFNRKEILRLRAMLRSKLWTWVYDLQTSKRSTLYQWLLARPWPRISNVSRRASHGYTDSVRHVKHALENLRIQLAIAGIRDVGMPDIGWLHEEITSAGLPAPPFALLVAGGAAHRLEKRWPAEQYASLAQELVSRGIRPVIIGSAVEKETLDYIAASVPYAINLCGRTSIAQLATLARRAKLAVGNDTGPMHVITAVNCQSTVLFSYASDPARSAPVGAAVTVLRAKDLSMLSVDLVLASLR